ncbi:MAG TPA: thiol reductant ABC exporter subunit CydD [Acetobacteraceae bacterium]|nr:thiol reductant ABC exporter subunit CydD [Acetobacteraceae bacterium]
MAARRPSEGQVWLAAQARPARRSHVRIVLLGLLGTVAAIAQAWCIARLLAPALGGPAERWWVWAASFAILALVRAGLAYVLDRLGFEAGAAARRRLRTGFFVGLFARLPLAERRPAGVLSALAVDRIEALDGYFGRWLPAAALAVAAPVLVAAAVLLVDPVASAVLAVAGLLVPMGMALAGVGAAAAARSQFVAMGRLQARFLDRVRGIATIVLAGQAEAEAQRLQQAADELTRRTLRVLRVAFLSSAALDTAAVAALIVLAVRFGREDLADPAAAIFPLLLVAEFFAPLRAFASAYQDRLHAFEAAEQLAAVQAAPPPAVPLPVRTVEARGVTVAFENVSLTRDPKRGKVLDGLSFRVPAGETAILVGPSGAGKTTVIELLLGFLRPDSGRITLNGADLASITPQALSRMTAWIGQRPVLFAGSIRENIRFGRDDASEEEVEAAARAAGLSAFAASLPQGLDTVIGEEGYGLSGGQAQRVAIARAFVRDAPLLLLDEPTAHLDPATEADVLASLRRLTVGRTVVLASHSSAAASFAGRRVVLAEAQARRAKGAA